MTTDTNQFLRHLLASWRGFLELRLIPGTRAESAQRWFVPAHRSSRVADVTASALGDNHEGPSALLFGVNARSEERGTDAAICSVGVIVADLDGKGLSLRAQTRRAESLARIVRPFAVVESGSPDHLHFYWRVAPACRPEVGRALGRRLREWLCADPMENASRTMRLPGSMNWKSGSPVPVRVAEMCTTAFQSSNAFARALDRVGAPATVAPKGPKPQRVSHKGSAVTTASPAIRALLGLLSPRMRGLVVHGWRPETGYRSRSEADLAAARALSSAGASRQQIRAVFERYPIGAKFREGGDDYLDHTLDKLAVEPPSEVIRVVSVYSKPSRVTLLVQRARRGAIKVGISRESAAFAYLMRSAGLIGRHAPRLDFMFLGKRLRVRIRERGFLGQPEVTCFLPRENRHGD
jgi:hypothetical protein